MGKDTYKMGRAVQEDWNSAFGSQHLVAASDRRWERKESPFQRHPRGTQEVLGDRKVVELASSRLHQAPTAAPILSCRGHLLCTSAPTAPTSCIAIQLHTPW